MTIRRRSVVAGAAIGTVLPGLARAASAPEVRPQAGVKVLRYAFEVAETSFDPVKVNDLYSRTVTPHIFEALYAYDHLARPLVIKPLTADGMPEHSDDFRVWTVRIKPGIYFASDPAFKGKRRELVARDYVYAFKRFAYPANKSPVWSSVETQNYVGLSELRQRSIDQKKPFDYDREIEGIRALDRYTVRFVVRESRPRLALDLAASDLYGAVAREVVEFYGDQVEAHPVGTGPFKLAQWRRSSLIVLERNPDFREMLYDAEPTADDAEGQALLRRFKGRRLPMVDRVEISIIEEEQPRWLSFVNDEADFAYRVGYQFAPQAMPNGKVAPNLAKRGIRGHLNVEPAGSQFLFNMDDQVVGGYSAAQVALRRAIGLGLDTKKVIAYAYNGLGTLSQGPTLPGTSGFEPTLKTEFSDYDPARARALLDLYGFLDKDGNGWRERPDGSPLVIHLNSEPQARNRKIAEVFVGNLKEIGIQVEVKVAQWPENLKAARAGNYQMWGVGSYAASPDSGDLFQRFDSHQIGGQNMARLRLTRMDQIYEKLQSLPDGGERKALFREAERLAIAYMPYKFTLYRMSIDMTQKRLIGYRRPVFWQEWWHYVDIDDGEPPAIARA